MKNKNLFKIILTKAKNLSLNQQILIFAVTFILAITIPLIFFIFYFSDQQISTDVSNWGDFGSFVNGVIGVIIALANLVVLIVITIQVNKLNSEENKNLFLYKKRVEAYDELAIFLPSFKFFLSKYDLVYDYYLERKNNTVPTDLEHEFDERLYSLRKTFNESYYFITSYNKRYGYLFDYDFKSEEFISLINLFHNIHNSLLRDLISLNRVKRIDYDNLKSKFSAMNNLLDAFVDKILKELQ